MVGYTFKQRFVAPIQAGTKRQTIRAPRKAPSRHALPGNPITCLTGPRFKPTTFHRAVCKESRPVILNLEHDEVTTWGNVIHGAAILDTFAERDGFADWAELKQFWKEEHDGVKRFVGVLIEW